MRKVSSAKIRNIAIIVFLLLTLQSQTMHFMSLKVKTLFFSIEKNQSRLKADYSNSISFDSYLITDPIIINNDNQLASKSHSGIGTVDDPYILEGLNIDCSRSSGLYITNTTKSFIVRNCWMHIDNIPSKVTAGIEIFQIKSGTIIIANNTLERCISGLLITDFNGTLTIENNTFTEHYSGIWSTNSNFLSINYNNFSENRHNSIDIDHCSNSTITNNNFSNDPNGLEITNSGNSTISANHFFQTGLIIHENSVEDYLSYEILENRVNNYFIHVFKHESKKEIKEQHGQLLFINCSDISVLNQNCSNTTQGAFFFHCQNMNLKNSIFSGNTYKAVSFHKSDFTTISTSTCTNNSQAFYISDSHNCTIINNTLINNLDDILVEESVNASIIDNKCFNSVGGIHLDESKDAFFSKNILNNCTNGLIISYSPKSIIKDNNFTRCGLLFENFLLTDYLSHTVDNNYVNGRLIGIFKNILGIGFSIDPDLYGQIIVINCTYINLIGMNCSYTTQGVSFYYSDSCTIRNSTCNYNSQIGISFHRSNMAYLSNNSCCYNQGEGIYLSFCDSSNITDNYVFNSGGTSIKVTNCPNTTIDNNEFENASSYGLYLVFSDQSNITNNLFISNKEGSRIVSDSCLFENNTFIDDGFVFADQYLYSISSHTFKNNSINSHTLEIIAHSTDINVDTPCGQIIMVNCTNIIVEKQNCSYTSKGLFFYDCSNILLTNNTILHNSEKGIHLENSNNSLICNNALQFNDQNIFLDSSTNVTIRDNVCTDGMLGIYFFDSSNISINNNTFIDNDYSIRSLYSNISIITNNNFSFNRIGIDSYTSNNITIYNNLCWNNTELGFDFENSNNSFIISNILYNNSVAGVYLSNSFNSTLRNNCVDGILLYYSGDIIIENNIINNTVIYSLLLESSYSARITNNTIANNSRGIILISSLDISIIYNEISCNQQSGILIDDSDSSSIQNNILSYNNYSAINLELSSKFNTILNNDFVSNNIGAISQTYDDGVENNISYNFWDDWTSPDEDNNSIVDIPYAIEGESNNEDPFPRATPVNFIIPPDDPDNTTIPPDLYYPIIPKDVLIAILVASLSICSSGFVAAGAITINRRFKKRRMRKKSSKFIEIKIDDTWIAENRWLYVSLIPIFWIIGQILFPPRLRKLKEEKVLNNPLRRKILTILEKRDFEHFSSLKMDLKCGSSILEWHLQVLEDFEMIKVKKIGQYRVFYLKNKALDLFKLKLYILSRSKNALSIINHFYKHPSKFFTMKGLSDALDIDFATTTYHFKKLIKTGLLEKHSNSPSFRVADGKEKYLKWLNSR